MARRRRKAAYLRNQSKRTCVIVISAVVLLMVIVVGFQTLDLNRQQREYDEQREYYLELIAQEEERSLELEEFEKYTHTTAYIEEVAKSKLGLVKDGEILFIAE